MSTVCWASNARIRIGLDCLPHRWESAQKDDVSDVWFFHRFGQADVCLGYRALRQNLLQFLANLYEQFVGLARVAGVGQRQQGERMNVHDLAKLGQLVQGGIFQVAFQ